jgi:phosphoribosylaminoimidazolecarboxamide formyltransferase/IMP cyclohydrolase
MIANWLTALDEGVEAKPADAAPVAFSRQAATGLRPRRDLRYGENPHQSAAFYRDPTPLPGSIAAYTQLQGKELSYNNIADADAAWECVKTFDAPACVIIKHANPCGVAIDASCSAPTKRPSRPTRPRPSAASSPSTAKSIDVVEAMNERKHFVEVLIAPSFTAEAKAALAAKQNLRVLVVPLGQRR